MKNEKELLVRYKETREKAEAEISRLEHQLAHELASENLKQLAEICQDLTNTIRKSNQFNMVLALRIDNLEARLVALEGENT